MVELICSVDPYFHNKSVIKIKERTLEKALIEVERVCGYGYLANALEDNEPVLYHDDNTEYYVKDMTSTQIMEFIRLYNGDGCDFIISIIHDGEVIFTDEPVF